MVPTDLLSPAPRDLAQLNSYYAKSDRWVLWLSIAGVAIPGTAFLAFSHPAMRLPLAASVLFAAPISLFCVGMYVWMQWKLARAKKLLRTGVAMTAVVEKVSTRYYDNSGSGFVRVDLRYGEQRGTAIWYEWLRNVDCRKGDSICVLVSPSNGQRFAAYTKGLGVTSGRAY